VGWHRTICLLSSGASITDSHTKEWVPNTLFIEKMLVISHTFIPNSREQILNWEAISNSVVKIFLTFYTTKTVFLFFTTFHY
jgi:hypothetical protein